MCSIGARRVWAGVASGLVPCAVMVGLACATAGAQVDVRVMTWNVLGIGATTSAEFAAAKAILQRLGPDVVLFNEINDSTDAQNLAALAAQTGYGFVHVPNTNPFGDVRNAIISKHPMSQKITHTSVNLGGGGGANDITRWVVEAVITVPGADRPLRVMGQHWKADVNNSDEFRRGVESLRMAQAFAARNTAQDAFIVAGDVNDEITPQPGSPAVFTSLPTGLPAMFSLGSDLQAIMNGPGIANDPFANMQVGTTINTVPAKQKDGSSVTRPASGKRLDYVFVSDFLAARPLAHEVYDSLDEGLAGGIGKFGSPLSPGTSASASDHHPVIVDIDMPALVVCYADCDGSGVLNIFDYICFGAQYAGQLPYADCDGSGSFNVFDYICFGQEYANGCP